MAVLLNTASLTQHILEQIDNIDVGSGPERREGALEHASSSLRMIRRDVRGIARLVDRARIGQHEALSQLTDLTLELTSLLYATGAPHEVWRHWSGICALGRYLLQQVQEAAKFAALGGEWLLLPALPRKRIASKRLSERIVWKLLVDESVDALVDRAADAEDRAWLELGTSIPAGDHTTTEQALSVIAQHWMAEGDWRTFHPRSAPDFEPTVCAAAALARHRGFHPDRLSAEEREFLEPGLAEPEPEPLWSGTFSDAIQPEHTNGSVRGQSCLSS